MTAGQRSFACSGGGQWRFYTRNGVKVPLKEIRDEAAIVEARDGTVARDLFMEDVKAKLRSAERGELVRPDDVKTDMARASGIHELRWEREMHPCELRWWRLYYCEPVRLYQQRVMLALRFAEKLSPEGQDLDIDEAVTRYNWWLQDQ
ncbi:hypothetical protein HFP15_10575 [Amycolatopsis sp. K13G38]|uniref:Uncharacterized protein n=1 Tax=Amycolatopsis acididurans TaxID=2724524 RepID=A0ABX1J4V8_9PSEU|nr:hypothetical protein [Amycolatopsis acididurans]NKQ53326.1 hypothetical protein [Amycolatopsis acididurans]